MTVLREVYVEHSLLFSDKYCTNFLRFVKTERISPLSTNVPTNHRSSRSQMFFKIGVSKISKFLEKRLQLRCFPVNFCKIFKNNFFNRRRLVAVTLDIRTAELLNLILHAKSEFCIKYLRWGILQKIVGFFSQNAPS